MSRYTKRYALCSLILGSLFITLPYSSYGSGIGENVNSTNSAGANRCTLVKEAPKTITIDPFTTYGICSYLKSRKGVVSAALYDESSKELFLYNPGVLGFAASMIKVDILASILSSRRASGIKVTAVERGWAKSSIELSDNPATESIWEDLGYNRVMDVFNRKLGFSQSVGNPLNIWGLSLTTPSDQIKLLRHIILSSTVIDQKDQLYIQSLMEGVTPSQRFGVPNGVSRSSVVGVKNGWDRESDGKWQVNTFGYVKSSSNPYMLVIMSKGNPNESYGASTVSVVSRFIWGFESVLPTYQAL